MILSILIPTLESRKAKLDCLVENLLLQMGDTSVDIFQYENWHIKRYFNEIAELIIYSDFKIVSTGHKRNELIRHANGLYTWFVDDDDEIHDYAICDILEASKSKPDVIVFNGYMTTDGVNRVDFELRLGHPYKAIIKDGKEYYLRHPNHIVPIKKELIKNIFFEDISYGEDYKWAKKINDLGLLKTQEIIDKPIYHYKFVTKK